MTVIVPHIVDELNRVEAQVLAAQGYPGFPVHHPIDEYSVLFASRLDQNAFVGSGRTHGMVRFNWSDDLMRRLDQHQVFDVHFDFLQLPSKPWRIEAMTVDWGEAPLHEEAINGNPEYCGVFHASYKLESGEAYIEECDRLTDLGLECSAIYQNSYGLFSYWRVEPHLPYFKPRCNLRDSPAS